MSTTKSRSRTKRIVLITLGLLNIALGTIGIFVPGLPTTVFLLIASWLFARSSPRLYQRLHAHPQLGRFLAMARDRSMPLRARLVSIAAIWGGTALALGSGRVHHTVWIAALLAAGTTGTGCVLALGRHRVGAPLVRTAENTGRMALATVTASGIATAAPVAHGEHDHAGSHRW